MPIIGEPYVRNTTIDQHKLSTKSIKAMRECLIVETIHAIFVRKYILETLEGKYTAHFNLRQQGS